MKKFLIAFFLTSCVAFSQDTKTKIFYNEQDQKITVKSSSSFFMTAPVREWPLEEMKSQDQYKTPTQPLELPEKHGNYIPQDDQVVQREMGQRQFKNMSVSFDGQNGTTFPPDPSGAAGPNHYVQAVNRTFRVYDKTGNPLTPEFSLNSLFPNDTAELNSGDPIVMYDRHADRWFISQFHLQPNKILIAISQTPDPTGSYFVYSFDFGAEFPDYPKYSVWWDGYYMTSNMSTGGSAQSLAVFERDKMLAGDPTAQFITLSHPLYEWFALPADADGPLPPNGTPCYMFHFEDDEFTGTNDKIMVYEFTTDWVSPSNTQIVHTQEIAISPYSTEYNDQWENIGQPGSSQYISALPMFPCLRAQHMRWVGYNTIILTQTVREGGIFGPRWVELRDADDGVWNVYQEGTFIPDNTQRWFAAAAMDNYGNICMAYSVCNAGEGVYPGIRYTGRLANDPLNEMTFDEKLVINGLSSQTDTYRYGDYSHMSLDPDGETFWFTGEYMGPNGQRRTRIFATQMIDWDSTSYAQLNEFSELDLKVIQVNKVVQIQLYGINSGIELSIDLIGMNGRVVKHSEIQSTDNEITHSFDVSDLSEGMYFARIGNRNFQEVKKIVIK